MKGSGKTSHVRHAQQKRHLFLIISRWNTPNKYAVIIFLATVVLYFICTNLQSYHGNSTFCKCFHNQRIDFIFHLDI